MSLVDKVHDVGAPILKQLGKTNLNLALGGGRKFVGTLADDKDGSDGTIKMARDFVRVANSIELGHGIRWMMAFSKIAVPGHSTPTASIDHEAKKMGCDLKMLKNVKWQKCSWVKYCSGGCWSQDYFKRPKDGVNKRLYCKKCHCHVYITLKNESRLPKKFFEFNPGYDSAKDSKKRKQDDQEEDLAAGPEEDEYNQDKDIAGHEKHEDKQDIQNSKKKHKQKDQDGNNNLMNDLFGSNELELEMATSIAELKALIVTKINPERVLEIVKDLQKLQMTVAILKETKVGVLMNECRKAFSQELNIIKESTSLLKRWMKLARDETSVVG